MKKVILTSCDIIFEYHTANGRLHHSNVSYKPKKEVSIVYGFWDCVEINAKEDLRQKLSENKKLMKNLRKIALQDLKDERKQGYVELKQGQAVTGKHIIKVTFDFEKIKYKMKKIKKKK